jgi:hypothetical protein
VQIKKDVLYAQAKNCSLCLHIGTVAFLFGRGKWFHKRIELFTPLHIFRITA